MVLVSFGSPQEFANQLGNGLLTHELERGFTVIRADDGGVSFALGLLPPGERPVEPYVRANESRTLLANERIEIHQNQRDFAGPFDVDDGEAYRRLTPRRFHSPP